MFSFTATEGEEEEDWNDLSRRNKVDVAIVE
jgi:hypothetical protein